MTDTSEYRPISCAAYSDFEHAIVCRRRLHLRWVNGNVIHDEIVTPLDLQTLDHQEFLICRDDAGASHALRLDRIRHVEEQ
jgi:transcriptional antiterminator Rof (Rho-off)